MDRDDLVYLSREPLTAETALDRQVGVITPTPRHLHPRSLRHARSPASAQRDGAVRGPLRLAGNGRAFLEPPVAGLEIA